MITNNIPYLIFVIANRLFAIEATKVLEVLINQPIEEIPKSENYVSGIVNFRGEIVTVVDLQKRMGEKEASISSKFLIVIETNFSDRKNTLSFIVQKVIKVIPISPQLIQNPPDFGGYLKPDYIDGIFYQGDVPVVIINFNKVFNSHEISLIEYSI